MYLFIKVCVQIILKYMCTYGKISRCLHISTYSCSIPTSVHSLRNTKIVPTFCCSCLFFVLILQCCHFKRLSQFVICKVLTAAHLFTYTQTDRTQKAPRMLGCKLQINTHVILCIYIHMYIHPYIYILGILFVLPSRSAFCNSPSLIAYRHN